MKIMRIFSNFNLRCNTLVEHFIIMILVLSIVLLFSSISNASSFCGVRNDINTPRGEWLDGSWGVRVVIPGGNRSVLVDRFKSKNIIDQLAALKTPKWVMLNLTEPAFGSMYTSPLPSLNKNVSDLMTPVDDLLQFYIDSLRKNNYKIILYFASQGPSLEYLSGKDKKLDSLKRRRPKFYQQIKIIDQKWNSFLNRKGISNYQGTADIIRYYSNKFGNKVDGWWFDHGVWGDSNLYIEAALTGNDEAVIAWNENHMSGYSWPDGVDNKKQRKIWMLTRSVKNADYTDGHISLTRFNVPWWKGNEMLVKQVESCDYISGARPHLFVPLQSTWRGGNEIFPEDIATDWANRVINSGGAITWAVALQPPEFSKPAIWDKSYKVLKAIDGSIIKNNSNLIIRNKLPATN